MIRELLMIGTAYAQDVVPALPPVPTTGVSPVVQWLMGLTSVILSVAIPLAVMWIKQHMNLNDTATRAGMVDRAIVRGGVLAHDAAADGNPDPLSVGLNYVKNAYPDQVAAIDQATDDHLRQSIKASATQFAKETNTPLAAPSAPIAVTMTGGPTTR